MSRTLLLVAFAATVSAQTTRITWVGQACFYVTTEGGATVTLDPPAANQGYTLPATPAAAVAISHNHGDHNNSAGVRGTPVVVDGRTVTQRTESTVDGIPFVRIPGFHDASNGSARGQNTIVQWTQGGLRFAHFGDYGQASLTPAQLADLRDIDVAMIPAGGNFTITAAQAAELVAQFRPRVAILMHYRTAFGGNGLAGHPEIAAPFPQIQYKPASVALTRATLPAFEQVWVMEPSAEAIVTSAANLTAGAPVAPGSLATLWGLFTGSRVDAAPGFPLPRQLGGVEVVIGTSAVPLLYVSPSQINFQVPAGLAPGQAVFEVRVAGLRAARGSLTVVDRSPGLFVAVGEDGRINRASNGTFLVIYGSGQGAVTPSPADGTPAGSDPFSRTQPDPAVTIGGRRAEVFFSGLAPGFAGLWQLNVRIPPNGLDGIQELAVQFAPNLPSNTLRIAVE
jgi:uncharacterized protein (TIGR03437 family)